ncbi:hypothetical protein AWB68_07839 [Caballeronia choica]|jgi:hypothetical protein|uniref:Uncharacterized protein n=1 Tax=Caballeronia choica TaxID=326476 RepID=A0A158KXK3_9BURK|nr:hypothetical protein AWB68_07839 [Caballeronia choica]
MDSLVRAGGRGNSNRWNGESRFHVPFLSPTAQSAPAGCVRYGKGRAGAGGHPKRVGQGKTSSHGVGRPMLETARAGDRLPPDKGSGVRWTSPYRSSQRGRNAALRRSPSHAIGISTLSESFSEDQGKIVAPSCGKVVWPGRRVAGARRTLRLFPAGPVPLCMRRGHSRIRRARDLFLPARRWLMVRFSAGKQGSHDEPRAARRHIAWRAARVDRAVG